MPEDNKPLIRSLIEKITAMQIAVTVIGLALIAGLTWFIVDRGEVLSQHKDFVSNFVIFLVAIGILAVVLLAVLYVIFSSAEGDGSVVGRMIEIIAAVTPMQMVASIIGILAITGIIWVMVGGNPEFLTDSAKARGLITFAVAIITVAIALILVFYVVFSNSDDLKERFTFGKDILMVFVGILGTIMGFYYGNTDKVDPKNLPAFANSGQSAAVKITVDLEQKAFQLVLKQDYDNALKAFDDVYNATVTSTNISNIIAVRKLLTDGKGELTGPDESKKKKAWSDLQCKISKDKMAQGMPKEIIDGFDKGCQAATTPTPVAAT